MHMRRAHSRPLARCQHLSMLVMTEVLTGVMTPGNVGVMTTQRTWWVESKRNSEAPFEAAKYPRGFYTNSTHAQDEAHAAELNRIIGWDKYRVATA